MSDNVNRMPAATVNDATTPTRWWFMSAYASAVKHGYRGTEEQWLQDHYGGLISAEKYANAADESRRSAQDSAASAVGSARASAASAVAADQSAAAAQSAAAEAKQEVLDDVPGMVDDWLEDAITNPSSPPLDATLSLANAAAQAKATGDAIKKALWAVDELGSVFESQNALYLYHQRIKDCPEYEFHFDADYDTGRWRKVDIDAVPHTKTVIGYNTSKHPVDVDDSMAFHIPPSASYSVSNSVSFCIGHMDDGAFVPDYVSVWDTANKGRTINIRRYKSVYASITNPKIILQTGGDLSLLQGLRLTRKNPSCELTAFPRVDLNDGNYGSFVPRFGTVSPYTYKPVGRYDGRRCEYYSTRAKSVKIEKNESGEYYRYSQADGLEIPIKSGHADVYLGTRTVVADYAKQGMDVYSIGTGDDIGTLILESGIESIADGARISYEYVVSTGSPTSSRPWHRWLYAGGLPIDAIFYDKDGVEILWYNGSASVNGCLRPDEDAVYPTLIKVPYGTASYHFAVYGPAAENDSLDRLDLGRFLAEFLYEFCSYGHADRTPIPDVNSGTAIHNAERMLNWSYAAPSMPTRYHLLTFDDQARAKGIVYAQASQFTLGTHISYYTYLSVFWKNHGYSGPGMAWPNVNSKFGMMCAAFVSAAVGLPHYQGVEYFIQKYTDKLVRVTPDMDLRPGDILVTMHYYRPYNDSIRSRYLLSHIAFVTDVLQDRENGYFIGHRVAESGNIYTHNSVWKLNDLTAKISDSQRAYTESHDPLPVGVPRACEAYTWRLRMPIVGIPDLADNYRFAADKEFDPINHPDIEFPPVLSEIGDRCIIGDYPVTYDGMNPGYRGPTPGHGSGDSFEARFYVEKAYPTINIKRSTDGGASWSSVAAGVSVGTDTTRAGTEYNSIDLTEYLTTPGIYKIEAVDGNDVVSEKYGLFLLPDYPASITRDAETGKIVHISGAALDVDEFIDSENYAKGSIVRYEDSKIYKFTKAHAAGTWTGTDAAEVTDYAAEGLKVKCQGFDEVWLRVIPYPATGVDGVDGGVLPWGNYMYIPASEVWVDTPDNDSESGYIWLGGFGSRYDYVVGLTLYHNDFGGVEYRFVWDDDDPTPLDDDSDPDDGDDGGNPEDRSRSAGEGVTP